MKTFYTFLLISTFLFLPSLIFCQPGTWTWMNGDSAANHIPNFGQMGVAAPTNDVGTRYACGYWVDTAGNFWVYSGYSQYSYTTDDIGQEDLWMFNPVTNEWTWMNGDQTGNTPITVAAPKGQYSANNTPGYLYSGMFTWVTADNHLWLYGGGTADAAGDGWTTSNLWQYDPVINQWAWMGSFGQDAVYGTKGNGDSTTMPGARYEGNAAWTDSAGNLWLFGGYVTDTLPYQNYQLNDMWMYNVATGIWTWMSGSGGQNDAGVYGTQGTPSVNYYPSARETNVFWKDSAGNFWLYGGEEEILANAYWFEDVWKFNPQTLEWTWVSGPNSSTLYSNEGEVCNQDTSNMEGSRYENRAVWKVCENLVINYGGYYDWAGDRVYDDLWAYSPQQKIWDKLTTGVDSFGHYGIKGVANPLNSPPARRGAVGFVDKNKNLWMFGGTDYQEYYYYNDLWKYVLSPACLGGLYCGPSCAASAPSLSPNTASICPGDSTPICATSGYALYTWNNNGAGSCIEAKDTGAYYVNVTDSTGCTAKSDSVIINRRQIPSPLITANATAICPGDSAYICAPDSFISYYWNNSAPTLCIEATTSGDYYVSVTDTAGCIAESNHISIVALQAPSVNISATGDTLRVFNTTNIQWYLNDTAIHGATQNIYIAAIHGSYTVSVTDTDGCTTYSSPVLFTGIENISNDDNVSIYPNPLAIGSWQLEVGNNLIGAELVVLDDNGRVVYKGEITKTHSEIAASLSGGIYLLQITSGTTVIVRKLVKL